MSYRTDIVYVYDGSFEGFLSCVHESYYQRELPSMIFSFDKVQETLYQRKEIETDTQKAQKVEYSIRARISSGALHLLRCTYLSHIDERELAMLQFLRMGYQLGPKVVDMLSHDVVRKVTKAAQNMQSEAHFYREFLRFSEYNGALVAIIEPKNFVLPITAPHFCDRFPSEQFLIYDKTHKCAFVYEKGVRSLIPLETLDLPEADAEEKMYRQLWKTFYNTIAIEGRINPKLRMNNMPKRYWAQMTEFMDE